MLIGLSLDISGPLGGRPPAAGFPGTLGMGRFPGGKLTQVCGSPTWALGNRHRRWGGPAASPGLILGRVLAQMESQMRKPQAGPPHPTLRCGGFWYLVQGLGLVCAGQGSSEVDAQCFEPPRSPSLP